MSTYSELVIADGAFGYWRLGEPSGTSAVDSAGTNTGTYVNTPTLGASGLLLDDPNTAVTFAAASSQRVDIPFIGAHQSGDCSYEALIQTTTTGAGRAMVGESASSGTNVSGRIGTTTANVGAFALRNSAGTTFTATGTTVLTDGLRHRLIGTEIGTAMTLYVDGIVEATATFSGSKPTTQDKTTLGAFWTPAVGQYWDGTLQECAIYKLGLTAQQALNHTQASKAQFQGSAHDVSASSSSGVAVGSLAWSHTVASHGARGMVVGVSIANTLSQTVTGVTFGAASLTFLGALNNGTTERVELWGLSSPAVSTGTVTVTFSAAAVAVAGSTSLYNVDPNPFSAVTTASGTGTAASVSPPGGRFYDLVHDVIASAAVSLTVGAGQRQRWNVGVAGVAGAGSTAPGTAASLAWTNNTSVAWAQAAVNVKALRAGNAMGLLGVG